MEYVGAETQRFVIMQHEVITLGKTMGSICSKIL